MTSQVDGARPYILTNYTQRNGIRTNEVSSVVVWKQVKTNKIYFFIIDPTSKMCLILEQFIFIDHSMIVLYE